MKPTKNRIFCNECRRRKMLFESEAKANRFLQFNSENFKGKMPLRAYYCDACMGWHVTSKTGVSYVSDVTENVLQRYRENKPQRIGDLYGEEIKRHINIIRSIRGSLAKKRETGRFDSEKVKESVKKAQESFLQIADQLIQQDRMTFQTMIDSINSIAMELANK